MQKNNRIPVGDIDRFKTQNCNENPIIINLLRTNVSRYLVEPILDIGAGLGDIPYKAFPDKTAYLIDVNDFSKYPVSLNHTRIVGDFFDYIPKTSINTVLISHTLQCLDDDLNKLNKKLHDINPRYIVCIQNENNDYLGEIIEWSKENLPDANPEIWHSDFPQGYTAIQKYPFSAELVCEDFDEIASLLLNVIMLATPSQKAYNDFIIKLKSDLGRPELTINQSITVYERQ